jgi:CheY-like chemotaxis protein
MRWNISRVLLLSKGTGADKFTATPQKVSKKGGLTMGAWVVLVVEDEWFLRDSIARHLREARLDVLEAGTGELALSHLEAGRSIGLVFTDIQLGGRVTGWDVGARYRKAFPEIPIIYTSGTAVAAKFTDPRSLFFPKPYEPNAIIKACQSFLEQWESWVKTDEMDTQVVPSCEGAKPGTLSRISLPAPQRVSAKSRDH